MTFSPSEVVESEAQPVTITSTKHQKTAGTMVIPPLRRRFRPRFMQTI